MLACLFAGLLLLFPRRLEVLAAEPWAVWVLLGIFVGSTIWTLSTAILGWRAESRAATESMLRIAQLERELAAARGGKRGEWLRASQ